MAGFGASEGHPVGAVGAHSEPYTVDLNMGDLMYEWSSFTGEWPLCSLIPLRSCMCVGGAMTLVAFAN